MLLLEISLLPLQSLFRTKLAKFYSSFVIHITQTYTRPFHQVFSILFRVCLVAVRPESVRLEPDLVFLRADVCSASVSFERPVVYVLMCRLEMPDKVYIVVEAGMGALRYLTLQMNSNVFKLMYPCVIGQQLKAEAQPRIHLLVLVFVPPFDLASRISTPITSNCRGCTGRLVVIMAW